MTNRLAPAGTVLPPYQSNTGCPKCGHRDIMTTHVPNECSDPDCTICNREHLRRTCRGCQYAWAEAVIDLPSEVGGNG